MLVRKLDRNAGGRVLLRSHFLALRLPNSIAPISAITLYRYIKLSAVGCFLDAQVLFDHVSLTIVLTPC